MTSVGAYEAKTKLSELLDEVERGRAVTITRHGREVARLVPVATRRARPGDVIQEMRALRHGVRRGRSSVRKMIAEGRR